MPRALRSTHAVGRFSVRSRAAAWVIVCSCSEAAKHEALRDTGRSRSALALAGFMPGWGGAGRHHGRAARNALTNAAELSEASWKNVRSSFSPAPPPARSERLRNAMNGVWLA